MYIPDNLDKYEELEREQERMARRRKEIAKIYGEVGERGEEECQHYMN